MTPEEVIRQIVENGLDDIFIIVKAKDGNFEGFTRKFGKNIQAREVAPEYCLQQLLTDGGK